jgi:hypothetical protein
MKPTVRTIYNEAKRGCGYRQPGGLYLMSDGPTAPCGGLPVPLEVCPTCHHGIHFSRSFTWIRPRELFTDLHCAHAHCGLCSVSHPPEKAGLLFIGAQFYPTPADWTLEALQQGVSRRIPALPKDFKIGETWVFVAHRKAIRKDGQDIPGIFHAFMPSRVEYIVKGDETEEELARKEKMGITLVKLVTQDTNHDSHQALFSSR